MIKINLLPYRTERKKELLFQQLSIALVPVLLTVLTIVFFWWSIKSEISNTENEIARIKQEIKKQEATIKKIDAFKKEKKTLTTKMGIINQLQKSKSGPVHVLDDLSISLPGRLWITSLKQKEMNLEISGKSLDNISISNYMTNLEKSLYFKNVDLKQIKTETKRGPKGIQLKKFLITCKIIYSVKNIAKKTPNKKKG
jgi:type IV pilus assembly protein PilN